MIVNLYFVLNEPKHKVKTGIRPFRHTTSFWINGIIRKLLYMTLIFNDVVYLAPLGTKTFSPTMEDDRIVVSFVDWSRAPRKASSQNGKQPHVLMMNVLL